METGSQDQGKAMLVRRAELTLKGLVPTSSFTVAAHRRQLFSTKEVRVSLSCTLVGLAAMGLASSSSDSSENRSAAAGGAPAPVTEPDFMGARVLFDILVRRALTQLCRVSKSGAMRL